MNFEIFSRLFYFDRYFCDKLVVFSIFYGAEPFFIDKFKTLDNDENAKSN